MLRLLQITFAAATVSHRLTTETQSPCVDILQHLSNYFMSESDTLWHIVRNSGHDYNDFGRYKECQTKHHMNYYLVTLLDKFPIPMAVGVCLPPECSLEDL